MKSIILTLTSLLLAVSAAPTQIDARDPHEIHNHHHHHHAEGSEMENMKRDAHEVFNHHHHHHADGTEMTTVEVDQVKRGAHEGHLHMAEGEGMEKAREGGGVYGKLW